MVFLSSGIFLVLIMFFVVEKQRLNIIRLNKALRKVLETDTTTGALNRFAFESDLETLKRGVLFLVDIDGFSEINDTYGMSVGDEVLRELVGDLKIIFSNYPSRIYRIGGDDLAVLIDLEKVKAMEPYEVLAERLIGFVEEKVYKVNEHEIHITIAVAISDEKPLFENADLTMHYVKRSMHLKYAVYSRAFNFSRQVEESLKTVAIIKKALREDRIIPFFQPIVENKTGVVEKYEALVRIAEDGKVISPSNFLPVAKKVKLYRDITIRVLEKVRKVVEEKGINVSVNLSFKDIEDSYMRQFIMGFLEEIKELSRKFTFEIVESENVERYALVLDFVDMVRSLGASIALDDFGAGYSNFMNVLRLKPDYIKIDGTLIENLPKDKYAQIVVSSIVELAKKAGIKTVAEFVSNEEIYRKVLEMGIDYSQGFYFGEPEPLE